MLNFDSSPRLDERYQLSQKEIELECKLFDVERECRVAEALERLYTMDKVRNKAMARRQAKNDVERELAEVAREISELDEMSDEEYDEMVARNSNDEDDDLPVAHGVDDETLSPPARSPATYARLLPLVGARQSMTDLNALVAAIAQANGHGTCSTTGPPRAVESILWKDDGAHVGHRILMTSARYESDEALRWQELIREGSAALLTEWKEWMCLRVLISEVFDARLMRGRATV